MAASAS